MNYKVLDKLMNAIPAPCLLLIHSTFFQSSNGNLLQMSPGVTELYPYIKFVTHVYPYRKRLCL